MTKLIKSLIALGLFFVLAVSANNALAVEGNTSDDDSVENTTSTATVTPKKNKVNYEEAMMKKEARVEEKTNAKISKAAQKQARLSEARLKLCEAKENAIENRLKSLMALGEKTHTGKEKIVERVDNFYNSVLVPKGYVLENYDALKSDIETKKANVVDILANAKEIGTEFSCDSDDPKGHSDQFRQYVQELINANREYKASVKAFVVAVRDLAKQAKADKNLSPSPSVSPAVSPEVTEAPGI